MKRRVEEYVNSERESLAEGVKSQNISDTLGHNPLTGTRISLGLLFLNNVCEAQRWFTVTSDEWFFKFQLSREHRLENVDSPDIDQFKWLDLIRGLQTAILSGEQNTAWDAAESALNEINNPGIRELSGLNAEPRVHLIGAMAAVIHDENPATHLERLEESLENVGRSHDWDLYGSQISVLIGIKENDATQIINGLKALEAYHEEYSISGDTKHFTEKAVNIYSCSYVVLARCYGIDIHVDSEYIPKGVYSNDYYPLEA